MDSGDHGHVGLNVLVLVVKDGEPGNEVAVHLNTIAKAKAKAVSARPWNDRNATVLRVPIQASQLITTYWYTLDLAVITFLYRVPESC
jgi:hypothetical protein